RCFHGIVHAENESNSNVLQALDFGAAIRIAGKEHAGIAKSQYEAAPNSPMVSGLSPLLGEVVHRHRFYPNPHLRFRLSLVNDIYLFAMAVDRIDYCRCAHEDRGWLFQLVDHRLVQVIAMRMSDKNQVCLRKTGEVPSA